MPLARIITRNPDDARELHQQLVDRGYQVEYADPSSLVAQPADLEIDLDRLPLDAGLRRASEWAREAGSDVYVAQGALPVAPRRAADEPLQFVSPEPAVSQVANTSDQILEQERVIEDQVAEQQPEGIAEVMPAAHLAEASPVADISTYAPSAFSQPEEFVQPNEEILQEEPAARSEHLREMVANAAGIFNDSLHETKEAVSQGFSDLKHRFTLARQEPSGSSLLERWNHAIAEKRALRQERKNREREIARLVRDERARREARAEALAQDLRELRARENATRPQVVQGSVAPVMHQHPTTRPAPRPILERRMHPPRRESNHDEGAEYWRGAFTGAAVVAVVLMIAWATLGTSHPPAPPHSTGQIKQDVPFGPVTLTPGVSTVRPAPAAVPATTPSPTRTATPRTTTPAPKPAPVRTQRVRRNTSSGVADDEVIVHHYGAPKPAPTSSSATAKNSGPKRITDQ